MCPDTPSDPIDDRTLVDGETVAGSGAPSAASRPSPGDTLAGRYLVIEELGRGGFGSVYRVKDLRLDRDVALKLLHPPVEGDLTATEFTRELIHEARAAARLEHPRIVPVYDAGELDGRPYLTMGLVRGPTLRRLLEDHGPLEPRRALTVLDDIAAALDHAHERGIIHRDVKPANIVVEGERARLVDFGVALPRGAGSEGKGQVTGTLGYIAPEVLEGGEPGPRSDLFSLGVVLYEMLTARVPFHGSSAPEIIQSTLRNRVRPPSTLRPKLAKPFDHVVTRALSRDPQRRFFSGLAMVRAARASLERKTPPSKPKERSPRLGQAALVGALAALLLLVGALGWHLLLREQTPLEENLDPASTVIEQGRTLSSSALAEPTGARTQSDEPTLEGPRRIEIDLPPPVPGRSAPTTGASSPGPHPSMPSLSVRLAQREGSFGTAEVIGHHEELSAGDHYWVEELVASREGYLYVLALAGAENLELLSPRYAGGSPLFVRAGERVRVPPQGSWVVEADPPGPRLVFAALSPDRLSSGSLSTLVQQTGASFRSLMQTSAQQRQPPPVAQMEEALRGTFPVVRGFLFTVEMSGGLPGEPPQGSGERGGRPDPRRPPPRR